MREHGSASRSASCIVSFNFRGDEAHISQKFVTRNELALLFLPFFNAGITSSDARKCHKSKQEAEKTKQAWNEDRKIDRTILVKAC
ncbi:hypothetical protein JCM15831A_13600 [Asaia astilbis]